jgi:hypothetical protein
VLKLMCAVACICLVAFPLFSQSASKYEVATITAVKPHQPAGTNSSDAVKYDVSLRVGDTIYMTVYTDSLGTGTVKYAAGRELLVLVGEKTIRFNNILGQSLDVPIVGRKQATGGKSSK